jgi:hypothetical protein
MRKQILNIMVISFAIVTLAYANCDDNDRLCAQQLNLDLAACAKQQNQQTCSANAEEAYRSCVSRCSD